MELMSLASTALGAVIALVATVINERFKWKREQVSNRRKLRQRTYSTFLASLTDAHERMRAQRTAVHETTQARSAAVLEAFRDSGCYPLRYELAIVAEQNVIDSAEKSFRMMRDIRDYLAEDGNVGDAEYKELRSIYGKSLRELQQQMRTELDAPDVELTGGS